MTPENVVLTGDCVEVMAGLDPESVDAIVTDPPYGLEFMGKSWDRLGAGIEDVAEGTDRSHPFRDGTRRVRYGGSARSMQSWHEAWAREAFRVAKPSAYLLAFGGTRTVHRMTTAIEDAGWIIRDMLVWAYASGFPKSKASLKPAWEPIVMARKPGPLRMLAIDACRIAAEGDPEPQVRPTTDVDGASWSKGEHTPFHYSRAGEASANRRYADPTGRWPANLILTATEDGRAIFDGGVEGVVGGGESASGGNINGRPVTGYQKGWADERWFDGYQDEGTYSRYFLIPKADRTDREPVLGGAAGRVVSVWGGDEDDLTPGKKSTIPRRNHHPTVKPTELMRHLVRLVTPADGLVFDPFLGSGTTAIAAELEGFRWLGIEQDESYVAIAEARLNGTQRGMGLVG